MAEENVSQSQTLLKGSGLVFLGLILELGIGFVAQLIIARKLGRIGFGEVSIGVTIFTIASTIAMVGTHTAVARFLPRYDDVADRRGVIVTAFQIGMGLSTLVAIGVFVFATPLATRVFNAPDIGPIIRIFALAIPFLSLIKLTDSGMQGVKRAVQRVYVRNISLPIFRFTLVIVAVVIGLGEVGIAGAYLFAHVGAGLLGLYFLWKYTSLFASVTPTYKHREILSFSGPLVLSAAMGLIFSDIDTLLLGYYVSTGDVGIYRVVYPLGELMLVFLNSVSFLFLPVLSELHAEDKHDRMVRIYQVVTKWLVVLVFPIFLAWILFPGIIIRVFFGSEYISGGPALAVLAVGFLFHATIGLNSNMITAIGETKFVPVVNFVAALVNVGLNILLIPEYSFLGAAVATTISYLVLNGVFSVLLYRKSGLHPFGRPVIRVVAAVSAVSTMLYVPLHFLLASTIRSVVIAGLIFLPIYVATVLLAGGVGEAEKQLLQRAEERLDVDFGPLRKRL